MWLHRQVESRTFNNHHMTTQPCPLAPIGSAWKTTKGLMKVTT